MKKDLLYIYMYYLNDYKCFTYRIKAIFEREKKVYITELFKNHLLGKRVISPNEMNKVMKGKCLFGEYLYIIAEEEVDFKTLMSEYLEKQLEALKSCKLRDITK